MYRMVIYFRNGDKLIVNCEKCTITTDRLTGKIKNISWDGLKTLKPLFVDLDEVLCVYGVKEGDEDGVDSEQNIR